MNAINVLKVFVRLERDMAGFYGKLKNVSMLRDFVKTFESMEAHSYKHAEKIQSDYKTYKIPEVNIDPLIILHNRVKEKLMEEIKNEDNILFALRKLAETEEMIGRIYKSISIHYKNYAKKYLNLAEAIDGIGEEEFQHRDSILEEMAAKSAKHVDEAMESPDRYFTPQEHRRYAELLGQFQMDLEKLDLTESDYDLAEQELADLGTKLKTNRDDILKCVTRLEEMLGYQKKDPAIKNLLKKIKGIQLKTDDEERLVE